MKKIRLWTMCPYETTPFTSEEPIRDAEIHRLQQYVYSIVGHTHGELWHLFLRDVITTTDLRRVTAFIRHRILHYPLHYQPTQAGLASAIEASRQRSLYVQQERAEGRLLRPYSRTDAYAIILQEMNRRFAGKGPYAPFLSSVNDDAKGASP